MNCSLHRFVAGVAALAMAGCGGGGGGGSSSAPSVPVPVSTTAPPTSAPTVSLSIVGIDNTTPTALTAIHIGTTGVNPASAVTVIFQGPNGVNVTAKPMNVASDGTVEVAIPLYFDPTSGQTASANLSVAVSQSGNTSNSVGLSVADIPQQSAYGLPVGTITRTFYNMVIMQQGRQLGALYALQLAPGNTVALGSTQTNVSSLLNKNIAARNDADRIVAGTASSIPVGSVNGVAINYDQTTLVFQDRVLGWYLANLAAAMSSSTGTLSVRRPVGFTHRKQSINLGTVVNTIEQLGNIAGIVKMTSDVKDAGAQGKVNDAIIAAAGGLAIGAAILSLPAIGVVTTAGAATFAMAVATTSIWNHVYNEWTDLGVITHAAENGASSAQVQAAQQDMNSNRTGALLDGVSFALSSVDATSLGKSLISVLGSEVGVKGVVQSAGLISTVGQLASSSAPDSDLSTAQAGTNQVANAFTSSKPELFADVTGTANIGNSNGATSPLTGLVGMQIDDNTTNQIVGQGMADSGGSYDFVVPLSSSTVNYSNLRIQAFDPITSNGMGFQNVNLSGNLSATISMPTVTGTCNDTDAGTPDADDPDCD